VNQTLGVVTGDYLNVTAARVGPHEVLWGMAGGR